MDHPSTVLITGASGLLGTPLTATFRHDPKYKTIPFDHSQLDIADRDAVLRSFVTHTPALVINCAAFTKVDACEQQHELADRVNGHGAGNVAEAAAAIQARLIHISTDYVFDGCATHPYAEDHPTGRAEDLCAYGRSKLLGEQLVRKAHPSPLIVRTAWVYGEDGPCFPRTMLRLAKERPVLRVVNDQTGSPTYADDLAMALYNLAQQKETGTFHVTNGDQCTWFEFACEIVRLSGHSTPVEPIRTEDYPLPARRPKYSVLDNRRFVEAIGRPLRSWREAIAAHVRNAAST